MKGGPARGYLPRFSTYPNKEKFMYYPATFASADEGGFVVTFRDIPEAITQGETLEEAKEMAKDALITALEFYFEDSRAVPAPSIAKRGEHLIDLPASMWAKVLLLNEMVSQKIRPSELAARLGVDRQQITPLTKLRHTTKIDLIAAALGAMGKHLQLQVA